uniref:Prolyl 4-hydroxylase alpha subunit domain-containing protein n=1 Tax=Oryza punctata TaxID=4537 RepID=A0A0E0K802_ORYPU
METAGGDAAPPPPQQRRNKSSAANKGKKGSAAGGGGGVRWPPIKPKKDLQVNRLKGTHLLTVPNFFTSAEAKAFVDIAENIGFTHQGSLGPLKGEAYRDNDRISVTDPLLAQTIWESGINKIFEDISISGKVATSLNPNIRFYRYTEGQRFGRHIDESVNLGDGSRTLYTLLIYLSGKGNAKESSGQALVGGETVFYDHRGGVVAEVFSYSETAICSCEELINHILVGCPKSLQLWWIVLCTINQPRCFPLGETSFLSWWSDYLIASPKQQGLDTIIILVAWSIWKERHNWVFNNQPRSWGQVADLAAEAHLWREVAPVPGLALLHLHGAKCMLHEARVVKKNIKYVLRSDVVFA